jgi:uncharacterized YigZ family protein
MSAIELDSFLTVSQSPSFSQIKVNGSRFIAQVIHIQDQKQAEKKYLDICKKFYDATHNCFAYRISNIEFRYSDDGEPKGTAGYPILKVLQGHRLFQTLIVVTRYFGGKKLGPGGLVRAYSEAAKCALSEARIIKKINYTRIDIKTDYGHLSTLKNLIKKHQGLLKYPKYSESIHIQIKIPNSKIDGFQHELKNFLQHGVTIIKS